MRHMEQASKRPAHGVHQAYRRIGKRETAKGCRQHQVFARLGVLDVVVGLLDVGAHESHAVERHAVGEDRALSAHVAFDGMGQRVQSVVRDQPLWLRQRQLVVHDRCRRYERLAPARDLLPSLGVHDDRVVGHFRAGSRSSRDRDHGKAGGVELARRSVEQKIPRMPCHDRYGLRRIHRTAAAQADDAVMATSLQRSQTGLNHLVGGVGDYAIEHPASDVASGETFAHPVGNPLTHHDLVGDDKRTVCAPNPREDIRNQVQTALADLQDARYADSHRFPHLPSSLRVMADGVTPTPP